MSSSPLLRRPPLTSVFVRDGAFCYNFTARLDPTALLSAAAGPKALALQVLPFCSSAISLQLTLQATPVQIVAGASASTGAKRSITITTASAGLKLFPDQFRTTNAANVTVTYTSSGATVEFEPLDPDESAIIVIPGGAYTDAYGNVGAADIAIDVPPPPSDSPTAQDKAGFAVGATVAAAAAAGILGGGMGNLGRSVANLQFFAWSAGLAAPYIPESYWQLTQGAAVVDSGYRR